MTKCDVRIKVDKQNFVVLHEIVLLRPTKNVPQLSRWQETNIHHMLPMHLLCFHTNASLLGTKRQLLLEIN